MSDHSTPRQHTDPLWTRYEASVAELLAALDPGARITHNKAVLGRISRVTRQVDVWAEGQVVGLQVSVAVECKHHQRPIDITVVDGFVGKLLDIGADRGILYSYSGFTDGATARAIGSAAPNVMLVALATPEIVLQNAGVPGYPADLLVQDLAPQWIEELDTESFSHFLSDGQWSKWYL
ncbi:restriction endonuclease [Mycobacteroides chelonae]|uniref:restriction endonuclease n=1 Tax=Mycobacteroides chelonae TaxID=1774 RepID=UPI0009BF89FF|nr:restriction endonuclease [Mycobacteroides chelonae]